jgi:signal peptidase
VFPAVTSNILYHYIGGLYGKYPNIVYRLITTLALYIVPVTSKLSNAIYAFARLAVPLLIYVFIKALYGKRKHTAEVRKRRVMLRISTAVMAVLMLSFIMLVSGQAKYGLMVIATESMSGEINKGDAVLYVAYDDQTIKEGQVIIFEKNKRYVVHRVVNIVIVDGAARYYTKGDANEDLDAGYITDADIVGLTDFKIPYIGMPTLWLHDLIS